MRTLRTWTTEGKSALCFYFRKLPNRGYSFVNNSIGYKPADKSLRLSGEKFDTEFIPLGKNKKKMLRPLLSRQILKMFLVGGRMVSFCLVFKGLFES